MTQPSHATVIRASVNTVTVDIGGSRRRTCRLAPSVDRSRRIFPRDGVTIEGDVVVAVHERRDELAIALERLRLTPLELREVWRLPRRKVAARAGVSMRLVISYETNRDRLPEGTRAKIDDVYAVLARGLTRPAV